jgi:hypothetical protein
MQLTTALAEQDRDDEIAVPGDTHANSVFAEYEARRCVVCGTRYPPFGFGLLAPTGKALWACSVHRQEVDRQFRAYGHFGSDNNLATERHDEDGAEHRTEDHPDLAENRQASLF